jgi:hypothetical protein
MIKKIIGCVAITLILNGTIAVCWWISGSPAPVRSVSTAADFVVLLMLHGALFWFWADHCVCMGKRNK